MKYKWPEENSIELVRPAKKGKDSIKLHTYRYPNLTEHKKGIVTFVHEVEDYAGRYAYLAKKFAENGYDFNTVDHRGYGRSEGRKGVNEGKRIISDDLFSFADAIDAKFGGKSVPHFLVGHAFGGYLSTCMAIE